MLDYNFNKKSRQRTVLCLLCLFAFKSVIYCSTQEIENSFYSHTQKNNDINEPKNGFSSIAKRYVLYDVNRGEGFNLKRDVFVRIAPIIKSLNTIDHGSQWILVLPPWGQLPHWSTSDYFKWSRFFDVDRILEYIPVIEFDQYLDEFGMDNYLDAFYQLQHFPLNSPISRSWAENVKAGIECEGPLRFKLAPKEVLYGAQFWMTALFAKTASCVGVKGDSSNIARYLLENKFQSVMLDKAEVILWDHYGGPEWWEARKSLKFSNKLISAAEKWIMSHLPDFQRTNLSANSYLAIHLRRGDFVRYRKNQPSLLDVARQINYFLSKHQLSNVFIATDGSQSDVAYLMKETNLLETVSESKSSKSNTTFLRFDCDSESLTEGECAIIDQIIASWGRNFLGTMDSTFSLRIFEEREILGFPPDLNYYNLCTDALECSKSTRWEIAT